MTHRSRKKKPTPGKSYSLNSSMIVNIWRMRGRDWDRNSILGFSLKSPIVHAERIVKETGPAALFLGPWTLIRVVPWWAPG